MNNPLHATFIYNPLYFSQNQTISLSEIVAVISRVLPFEACLFGTHPGKPSRTCPATRSHCENRPRRVRQPVHIVETVPDVSGNPSTL
jgi:hypothetical protein